MKAATTNRTDPQFHFIGGKGGVGKTTCAAAFALSATRSGARVLVASTDPAPSLGDALKVPLSGSPRRVSGRLYAVEIDAAAVLRRWIADRRKTLEQIALQGTWLDRDDVAKLLRLSLPGIDEVASLLEISRLAHGGRFDMIVVDTAPTGHTLRMLDMPGTLFGVAQVFDRMREKHRAMVEALRGGWQPDAEDALIQQLANESSILEALLRDTTRTRISWVALPEAMAVAETAEAVAALDARRIRVTDIVVNRITPAPPRGSRCRHCEARRAYELATTRRLPDLPRIFIEARDVEPRGLPMLRQLGADLGRRAKPDPVGPARMKTWAAAAHGVRMTVGDLLTYETRVLMFGGKGGVGKTTCAAAFALDAAAQFRDRQVTLISVDPAHSLAHALGRQPTGETMRIGGRPCTLHVREMNSARVFKAVRQRYAAAIDAFFDHIAGGGRFDLAHDRSVMHSLIDLAPPGLDELAAIIEITDALSSDARQLLVIDTAPTGHALRLLEMPGLLIEWTHALMEILLKYQSVGRIGELGVLLLDLSRGLGRLVKLLRDRVTTGFIVVTRAAVLPRSESTRLIRALNRLEINVSAVIVNAVGRGTCDRCARWRAAEDREVRLLRRALRSSSAEGLVITSAQVPPPSGAVRLLAWQRSGWRYHQSA